MYLYKMLVFFILFSGLQVHGLFSPLEINGSGDGLNENSTYSRLPLLDDNGEISTAVTATDVVRNIEETENNFTDTTLFSTDDTTTEETTAKLLMNDTFTDATVTQDSTTAIFATDPPTTDSPVDSATTSTLSMSSTTKTTAFVTATTEEDSTTTEITTTSTTVKTTKKPIETDSATEEVEEYKTKPKDTTAKNPPTSAPVSTLPMSEDAGKMLFSQGKRCLFMDTGLKCDAELICYGDGEIDCTDDEEMDTDEMDSMEEMLSSVDDSDYTAEGKTSETFPIRRIGSNSMKIDLFKMFPLTPTNNDVSSEKNEELTTTPMPYFTSTVTENKEFFDGEKVMEMNDTMNVGGTDNIFDSEVTEELGSFPSSTESSEFPITYDDVQLSSSTDNSSDTNFTEDVEDVLLGNEEILITNFPNVSETEIPFKINETDFNQEDTNNESSAEDTVSSMDMTTSYILEKTVSESVTEGNEKEQPVITRTKRDKNANSSNGYYKSSSKLSELENSKKKLKVKTCKLSGNLVCFPRPTKSSCSGKTLCQVPPQAIETVEKPATQKGLEKWTIAVIVICAITATFTISLLIYLVFTSYKKLKVQPQNGVTTLNYVNSAQP